MSRIRRVSRHWYSYARIQFTCTRDVRLRSYYLVRESVVKPGRVKREKEGNATDKIKDVSDVNEKDAGGTSRCHV